MSDVVKKAPAANLLKLLLAVLLPPLAVLMEVGVSKHFWISLILTFFFWVPGVVHAMIIVMEK